MTEQTPQDTEEAYAGKDLGSLELVVTTDMLDSYYEGLEIDRAGYAENSTTIPSMVLTAADGGFPGARLKNAFGNLWMRQEWDMRIPAVVDQAYKVTSKVLDIYDWRERTVVKQQVAVWTTEHEMMAQGVHHQSYMLNQTSGKVKLRDPKAKEGVRRFAVPKGEELDPISRTITPGDVWGILPRQSQLPRRQAGCGGVGLRQRRSWWSDDPIVRWRADGEAVRQGLARGWDAGREVHQHRLARRARHR